MTIRLQEMHPALVHLPIAFTPVSIGADMIGSITGDRALFSFGRKTMAVAAVGAAVSGISGLIAGEEVNVEGESRDMLMTHRNLNFLVALAAGSMAFWRGRHERPNAAYLAAGVAVTGVLAYTAYLGGKIISEFGAGVAPAKGIYRPDAPALGAAPATEFAKEAATDLVHGVEHMVEEVSKGQIVPALIGRPRKRRSSSARSASRANKIDPATRPTPGQPSAAD